MSDSTTNSTNSTSKSTNTPDQVSNMFDENEKKLLEIFNQLGIESKTLRHKIITTMEEGKEIMKLLEGVVCVNLLLVDKSDNYYLVIKSLETKLNIGQLGKSLNLPGLKMAPRDSMDSVLKVPKGCATVFAISNNPTINILIDNSILKEKKVNFHPLRNDATTTISFDDMLKYINHFGNKITYF